MLKPGDKVKIVKKIFTWYTIYGYKNAWMSEMDKNIGKTVIIQECNECEFIIKECKHRLGYPCEGCIKINKTIKDKLK